MQEKLQNCMSTGVPSELFWPWKRVNLDPNEHAMPLMVIYLFASNNKNSQEVKNRSS